MNEAGAESCEYAPSGASDLHGGRLREVGQSGHELRDQRAVTTVLHEVGQPLGRAGDLNDGAGLRGDEAHNDLLAQDIMPNGVSKVTTWRLGSASVTVAFGTDCAAGVASWNSCSNGTLNWNACVVERIPMGVSP